MKRPVATTIHQTVRGSPNPGEDEETVTSDPSSPASLKAALLNGHGSPPPPPPLVSVSPSGGGTKRKRHEQVCSLEIKPEDSSEFNNNWDNNELNHGDQVTTLIILI